jgi:hypothetical protein
MHGYPVMKTFLTCAFKEGEPRDVMTINSLQKHQEPSQQARQCHSRGDSKPLNCILFFLLELFTSCRKDTKESVTKRYVTKQR